MDSNIVGGVWTDRTRKVIALLAVVVSVFVLAKAVETFKKLPYVGRDVPAMSSITVSGNGEAVAVPDIATFSVTIEHESLLVSKAQESTTELTKEALDFLKKNGVAEKDIKTTAYNIYPKYDYQTIQCFAYPCPSGRQTLLGYVVSQSIDVKVREIEDAGKLVAGMGELWVTQVSGLSFTVEEEDAVLKEARDKAITDAQIRAKELARSLGVKLVRIVGFSEGGNYPIYYAKNAAFGMGGDTASAPTPELPAGENKYQSNVSITYEIR